MGAAIRLGASCTGNRAAGVYSPQAAAEGPAGRCGQCGKMRTALQAQRLKRRVQPTAATQGTLGRWERSSASSVTRAVGAGQRPQSTATSTKWSSQ